MLIKQIAFLCLNRSKAALFFLPLCLIFVIGGCGKRKPPQPPTERVQQRAEVSGYQRGNRIYLSWRLPKDNATGGSLLNIARVEIYRLAEPIEAYPSLAEEEFAARATLITSLPVSTADFARETVTFVDTLEFAGQPARLRYSIRFVNSEGQRAAFSNFLLIEPAARVAESPSRLSAEIAEDAVRLRWTAPETNIDKTKPANILGYNVYRGTADSTGFLIINQTPVTRTDYTDSSFAYGATYKYFVRSVSLGTSGEPVESADSDTVSVEPRDLFAPSAPSGLTIAAAPDNISIFFASNPEKDVAGYRVYRSIEENLPLERWLLLTPELLKANTFQDKRIESGKTYFYYLTAIDTAGNVSRPSEILSETAP